MVKLTILGNLMSKSNSRIYTTRGRRPMLIKKPKAIEYEYSALSQIKKQLGIHEMILGPVKLKASIYYDSRRPDLDVSLLQDVLEKAGVYKNDRQIFEIEAYKYIDKQNPRCEVEIFEI